MNIRRITGMHIMVAAAICMLILLIAVPLAVMLLTSLRGPFLPFGVPSAQWGFVSYEALWELRAEFWSVISTTSVFVVASTVISVGIAGILAWIVTRTDVPWRNLIIVLVIVPYVIPPIVKAQAFFLMLSPNTGLLNQVLRSVFFIDGSEGPIDPFSFTSVVVLQGLTNVTFPFLLLLPVLQFMDGSLEEAARTSGATWRQTIAKVTLPVLAPAITGIIVLAAILSIGSLEIPLLFGQTSARDVFALKLWNFIQPNVGELPQYGLAAAYGTVFLVFTSFLFWVYRRATAQADRRASVTGKGFRPLRLMLGRSRPWVLLGVSLFLVLTAVLPLVALVWASLTPFPMPLTWGNLVEHAGFGAFGEVMRDGEFWASFGRTIVIAVTSSTLAVAVATALAYAVARAAPSPRRGVLDTLASASLAIPATIAGFAFFILFLITNRYIGLNGTLIALIIAFSYRISISYRTSFSATLQIKRELEEAAEVSGAPQFTTFRLIVLPLLMPAMFAVWIQMFILAANEFTLPAFMATVENRPLSTYLYQFIDPRSSTSYSPDKAAAMALIFTLFVLVVGYGLQWIVGRRSIGAASDRRQRRSHLITPALIGNSGMVTPPRDDTVSIATSDNTRETQT